MSLIGYARVSTLEGRQVLDRRLDARREADCQRVFENRASGADLARSQLTACLDYLRGGDVLVVSCTWIAWAGELLNPSG